MAAFQTLLSLGAQRAPTTYRQLYDVESTGLQSGPGSSPDCRGCPRRGPGSAENFNSTGSPTLNGFVVRFSFPAKLPRNRGGDRAARNAGYYYIVGYGGTIQVPAIDMIFSEKNIIGNLVGTYADLTELMTLAAEGKVHLATTFYPLAEMNQAIADLHHGRIKGRAVLIP